MVVGVLLESYASLLHTDVLVLMLLPGMAEGAVVVLFLFCFFPLRCRTAHLERRPWDLKRPCTWVSDLWIIFIFSLIVAVGGILNDCLRVRELSPVLTSLSPLLSWHWMAVNAHLGGLSGAVIAQ